MTITAAILISSRNISSKEWLPRRFAGAFPPVTFGSEDKRSFGFPGSSGENVNLGLSINLISPRQGRVPVFPDRFVAETADQGRNFLRRALVPDVELAGRIRRTVGLRRPL